MPLNDETPMVKLGDLLTSEQSARTTDILNGQGDDSYKIKKLKQYFNTIKADLEAKGALPEYLAYVVYLHYMELGSAQDFSLN